MKKILSASLMGMALFSQAQVSNYSFTMESGQPQDISTYPDIVLTNHTVADDLVLPAKVKIPFPFMFNGSTYDSVGISENGFIWFGAARPELIAGSTRPVSATHPASVRGIVSALGTDLHPHINTALSTSIRSGVTGTAPMRELIIEWKNTSRQLALAATGGEDTLTFQVKLYEFMNRVEIAYGECRLNKSVLSEAEVGLKGNGLTDFNNRMTDTGKNWNNSVKGADRFSTMEFGEVKHPVYGMMYVWTNPNQQPNGVDETETRSWNLYPVPAGQYLYVSGNAPIESLEVYSMDGRMLKSNRAENGIDLGDLSKGVYFLKIENATGSFIRKFTRW